MNATINPASGQPIAPEVLRTFAASVYCSAGVPEVEAQLAADTLVLGRDESRHAHDA